MLQQNVYPFAKRFHGHKISVALFDFEIKYVIKLKASYFNIRCKNILNYEFPWSSDYNVISLLMRLQQWLADFMFAVLETVIFWHN